MTDTSDSKGIHADLTFMKALVSEGSQIQRSGGIVYLIAGLCYGLQCLVQWIHLAGIVNIGLIGNLLAGILPTVVFLAVLFYILWRDRKISQNGVATRAMNAAFSSTGLANMAMVVVFAYVAITEKNFLIWLLYPITVCAFQGAAWFVAYMIRKELWRAFLSMGWFATALSLGPLIRTPHYVLVLAFALTILMGGGGWYMIRQARS